MWYDVSESVTPGNGDYNTSFRTTTFKRKRNALSYALEVSPAEDSTFRRLVFQRTSKWAVGHNILDLAWLEGEWSVVWQALERKKVPKAFSRAYIGSSV